MRQLAALLLFVIFSGCFGSTPDDVTPIRSPNDLLILTPNVNRSRTDPTKYLCIAFDISDASGTRLHRVQSSASDIMKWAIGWFDNRTIVLYSIDVGTRAWQLNDNKAVVELSLPLPPVVTAFGNQLKVDKYGQ